MKCQKEREIDMSVLMKPLFSEPKADDYLNAALKTAEWLRSAAIETENGTFWPEDPASPDKPSLLGNFSLYSGMPGVILFFLQLAQTTGDESYLTDAVNGGKYLINNWNDGKDIILDMGVDGSEWGPINGQAGPAFVLAELGIYTENQEFLSFSEKLFNNIAEAAKEVNGLTTWTGEAGGISYDPGIALYLLYGANIFNNEKWKTLVLNVGKSLVHKAKQLENGAVRWDTITVDNIGIDDGGEMPNFFYGTAGTAYALAKLYEEFGDQEFLDLARAGGKYVESICFTDGDNVLTPFCLPNPESIYFIGMCNGFSGTVRLFYELWKTTREEKYADFLERMVNGILNAGAPEVHFKGYWNVVCMCCGTSGLINVFDGLYAATGNEKCLKLSKRVGKYLLGQFTDIGDGKGCWYQSWHRLSPWIIDAKIGYYDGNSGEAIQILELYTAATGNFHTIRLPDDPYPDHLK